MSITLQDEVEVLTLDDDTRKLANRKRRTARKSTGVGDKASHLAEVERRRKMIISR